MNTNDKTTKHPQKLEDILKEEQIAKQVAEERLEILQALADVYYSMTLIDLDENTFYFYEAKNQVKDAAAQQTENDAITLMKKVMYATMSDAYLQIGLEFTDLTTLQERLANKKFISMDLLGKNVGWIRMSFINIDSVEKGIPKKVICTTQIIDDEKKREEKLWQESNTDELTGCYNRHAYEVDLFTYPDIPSEENFVYVALDINGLKIVNDSLGHEAGDELICGAAECMKRCLGNYGKIYRTGGDEFVAMIFAEEKTLENIKEDFLEAQSAWSGKLVDSLAISAGYVTKREFPNATVNELARVADERMYENKTKYYKAKGVDRKGQAAAHSALCLLYTKILKINITEDSYQIVNMDPKEASEAMGFADKISTWLTGFGTSGQVHPEDLDNYLEKTDIQYMRDYFAQEKTSLSIFYRRKYGEIFKEAMMEIIPADDYEQDNQTLFLYVKSFDK